MAGETLRARSTESVASTPEPGPSHPHKVKVVGYDGSASGRSVVRGAARRARPGDRLIIVRALEEPGGDPDSCPPGYRSAVQDIQLVLDSEILHGIPYELRVVKGRPAQALIDAAVRSHALGIVIGARRGPPRVGQRTIRAELEAGPVPVVALFGEAERESHPLAMDLDPAQRDGLDSFPASDPPSSWFGRPREFAA